MNYVGQEASQDPHAVGSCLPSSRGLAWESNVAFRPSGREWAGWNGDPLRVHNGTNDAKSGA
jgi:hypothetical protein